MKIAVINEVSASIRNEDIVNALHKTTNAEVRMWGEESGTNPVFNVYSHQLYGGCSFKYRQLRLRYWGMRHRTGFFKWCTAISGGGVRFDRGTVRCLALFTNKRRQLRVSAA